MESGREPAQHSGGCALTDEREEERYMDLRREELHNEEPAVPNSEVAMFQSSVQG